uniref:Uncharacterized protein n=1 Tax=Anguilla anguilla TaxID=7936 RepID=A0A0E9SJT2_ANGAN
MVSTVVHLIYTGLLGQNFQGVSMEMDWTAEASHSFQLK